MQQPRNGDHVKNQSHVFQTSITRKEISMNAVQEQSTLPGFALSEAELAEIERSRLKEGWSEEDTEKLKRAIPEWRAGQHAERETNAQRKARERREWDVRGKAVQSHLDESARDMDLMRSWTERLFDRMRDRADEPYKRRPPIGLRLMDGGEPIGKLVIVPHVQKDRTGLFLRPESQMLEFFYQRDRNKRRAS